MFRTGLLYSYVRAHVRANISYLFCFLITNSTLSYTYVWYHTVCVYLQVSFLQFLLIYQFLVFHQAGSDLSQQAVEKKCEVEDMNFSV